MRHGWLAVVGIGLLAVPAGAGDAPVLRTQQEMAAYGVGVDVGRSLRRQGVEVDPDLVVRGLRDAYSGGDLLLAEKDLLKVMARFRADLKRKQNESRRKRQGAVLPASPETGRTGGTAAGAEGKTGDGERAPAGVPAPPGPGPGGG